jgi:hypothetical protein
MVGHERVHDVGRRRRWRPLRAGVVRIHVGCMPRARSTRKMRPASLLMKRIAVIGRGRLRLRE